MALDGIGGTVMITFLPYTEKDKEHLSKMLIEEGITIESQVFDKGITYTMQNGQIEPMGFFTIMNDLGHARLIHFCIKDKYRSMFNARALVKGFKKIAQDLNIKRVLISVEKDNLKTMVEYYFKVKPFDKIGNEHFYFVEV